MALGVDADAVEHRQPRIAERCVLGRDDVVAEFEACGSTAEDRWTVREFVAGADVAAVGEGDVVEVAAAAGFLGGFELVEIWSGRLSKRAGPASSLLRSPRTTVEDGPPACQGMRASGLLTMLWCDSTGGTPVRPVSRDG